MSPNILVIPIFNEKIISKVIFVILVRSGNHNSPQLYINMEVYLNSAKLQINFKHLSLVSDNASKLCSFEQ